MTENRLEEGQDLALDYTKLAKLPPGAGVIPCAVQDADSGEVILVAYVNDAALKAALASRSAVFWSTSRNELWEKGKTSGETFDLLEVRVNCEQNSLLYRVRPRLARASGQASGICHTKNAAGDATRLLLPAPGLRDGPAGKPQSLDTQEPSVRLYNTLSGKVEEFAPMGEEVLMYVCGITPYSESHLGHAMSYIVFDTLRRYLEFRGLKVKHVQNYTDIDDKLIMRSEREGGSRWPTSPSRYIVEFERVHGRAQRPASPPLPARHGGNPGDHRDDRGPGREGLRLRRAAAAATASPATSTTASRRRTTTASSRSAPWTRCCPARASSRSRAKRTRWTSPCGRAPSPASRLGQPLGPGPARLAHRVLRDVATATSARRSTSTAAASTWSSRTTRTRSPRPRPTRTLVPFSRFWLHNGFLQLGDEKMSKSLGNLVNMRRGLDALRAGRRCASSSSAARYRSP